MINVMPAYPNAISPAGAVSKLEVRIPSATPAVKGARPGVRKGIRLSLTNARILWRRVEVEDIALRLRRCRIASGKI